MNSFDKVVQGGVAVLFLFFASIFRLRFSPAISAYPCLFGPPDPTTSPREPRAGGRIRWTTLPPKRHGPSQGTSGLNSDSKSRSLYQIPYQSEVPVIEGFGKGIKKDFNAKIPFYISDFKDGFNIKCLSSTFFLFFACLAPAVAFGGLLTASTGGLMGTMEAVSATAIGGVIYALFSAQPITIIGTTGPLIAFLSILHKTCML